MYSEGKHDDPADTQDRLVKIGTKYNATAPSVADGDNVYLLVDAAGRPLIGGAIAEGSAEAGNPVQIAGSEAGTVRRLEVNSNGGLLVSPVVNSAFSDGNTASPRVTRDQDNTLAVPAILPALLAPDGNLDSLRSLGDTAGAGLGVLAAAPWTPGASEVKSAFAQISSTTVATIATPASGKKIRLIAVVAGFNHATKEFLELYFGAGANITTNIGKEVAKVEQDVTDAPNYVQSWPDGAGPVGAADDVISGRSEGTNGEHNVTILYREE